MLCTISKSYLSISICYWKNEADLTILFRYKDIYDRTEVIVKLSNIPLYNADNKEIDLKKLENWWYLNVFKRFRIQIKTDSEDEHYAIPYITMEEISDDDHHYSNRTNRIRRNRCDS